jgi:hypothetical protein
MHLTSCLTLRLSILCLLASSSFAITACSSGTDPAGPGTDRDDAPVQGDPEGGVPGDGHGPTFYADVAPILAEHCATCHQQGGIAPFTLITYAETKPLALAIKSVTQSRTMPPFLPDNSGACATYRDAMWLSDDDLSTLAAWADAGAPEGDPALGLPTLPKLPKLDDANHEASMAESYLPSTEAHDDYRCFLLDDDMDGSAPLYVTDYEVVPGDARVVHHVIVFQPQDQAAVDALREKDASEAGPGYACYGGAGGNARMLMNWAPGSGAVHHPDQTGVEVDPALPLVMQVHYHTGHGTYEDRTAIRLRTEDSVTYPMRPWFFTDGQLNLPPGMERIDKDIELSALAASLLYSVISRPLFDNGPLTIMGVRAHMHGLGREMRIERESASGDVACLADIPHYDFDWQRSYFLEQPVPLTQLDTLRVRCTFSTLERDTATTWGEGTEDEMCLATLYTIEAESYE